MTNKSNLTTTLKLLDDITQLIDDNSYKKFLTGHLMPVKVELERQLTLQTIFDDEQDE
jgi:hypothetical protein